MATTHFTGLGGALPLAPCILFCMFILFWYSLKLGHLVSNACIIITMKSILREAVSVISSDPPCKYDNFPIHNDSGISIFRILKTEFFQFGFLYKSDLFRKTYGNDHNWTLFNLENRHYLPNFWSNKGYRCELSIPIFECWVT